jgi:Domain of unknown function (DUF2017)
MRWRERGIRAARDGSYTVRLEREEREILASLPAQLRTTMESDDPSLRRLFPPAFEGDRESEAEYRSLVHDSLVDGKLAALRVLEETATADHLTEEQLGSWLGALESLRLVLGTQLDVQDDTYASVFDHTRPDAPRLALYAWLSWLQEETIQALSSSFRGG